MALIELSFGSAIHKLGHWVTAREIDDGESDDRRQQSKKKIGGGKGKV